MTVRKAFLWLFLALAGASIPLALWFASLQAVSPEQRVADAEPPPPPQVTALLEERKLSDTLVFRGLVVPADTVDIFAPELTDRAAVVVEIPVIAGQSVEAGDILAVISDRPIIALPMAAPLYRTLMPGMVGEDVARFQTALNKLGYDVEVDGRFGFQSQAATKQLYEDRGFAAVRADELQTGDNGADVATSARGIVVPLGEVIGLQDLPAVVASINSSVGDLADDVLISLSSSELVVEARVEDTLAALLIPGLRAAAGPDLQWELEVVSNETTDDQGRAIVLLHPVDSIPLEMLGSDLRIEAELAGTDGEVLAAPISAVRSNADGPYLRVLAPGSSPRDVGVRVGLSIGGWVEILESDIELEPGVEVLIG